MNKKLKSMYKDIIKNRNLQENIPRFFNVVADKYHTVAAVRLALHYYTYYEMYCDESNLWDSHILDNFRQVNNIIAEAISNNKSKDETDNYIKDVDQIRNGIIARMDLLSTYTDLFEIYEYALNRVEYRFKDMGQLDDDEEIARNVLRFVFDSDNNIQINEMIKFIIGQLPMRITKQKYFDYLKDGFQELLGAQEDVFETYLYIIRSSAMLDYVDDSKDIYHGLWEKKEYLEKLNFKEITKEEYKAAIGLVKEAGAFLERETTTYISLMEIVNELYTILLCAPYKDTLLSENREQKDAAFYIINKINTTYFRDKQEELPQEMLNSFSVLEGFQEDAEFDLISLEDALFHINEQHKNLIETMNTDNQFNILLKCKDLMSDSLFIDLHKINSTETVDKVRFQKEIDKLIEELTDKFQKSDRMIIRAIMANTLDKLPVFFNNHSEVKDYVLYSLNKCTDVAEKYACVEIINEIMTTDN